MVQRTIEHKQKSKHTKAETRLRNRFAITAINIHTQDLVN